MLDEDPDLAATLGDARRPAARGSAIAPLVEVPLGPWEPPVAAHDPRRDLGMLVLSGLLARDQHVAGRTFTDLHGPEDLLRPWDDVTNARSIEGHIGWSALQPTRLAWLDGEFASAVAWWPEIASALMGRAIGRARRLSFRIALLELKHVDLRVLLLLWHLANRWGRVRADGVYVDLALTHELIARMVGAHRTTVTLAVGRLRDEGRLGPPERGGYLLLGGVPDALSDFSVVPRAGE